jgi:hypothetical protein
MMDPLLGCIGSTYYRNTWTIKCLIGKKVTVAVNINSRFMTAVDADTRGIRPAAQWRALTEALPRLADDGAEGFL